jgi:hypothetical protein
MGKLNLKEQLAKDVAVFFNPMEFGEEHTLDGRVITCVIDNDRLKERSKKEYEGISVGEILLFVKIEDVNKKLEQGMPIVFDKRQMYVFDIRKNLQMYEIILSQNVG